jgi:hypothetical protein
VKATDSHMDDARFEARAVVSGHGNPATFDLGKTGLSQADGGGTAHVALTISKDNSKRQRLGLC